MKREPILVDLPEVLLGEKVVLRSWKPGDGPELYAAIDACRPYLREWLPWAEYHSSSDDSEIYVRRSYAKWILREDLAAGIFSAETGEILGATGLHRVNWDVPSFEIGYWLAEKHQGHGYVTEAVRMLCNLAFNSTGAHRVTLLCDPNNHKSESVAKRVGFKFEGTQENWGRSDARGLFATQVYALTSADWQIISAKQNR